MASIINGKSTISSKICDRKVCHKSDDKLKVTNYGLEWVSLLKKVDNYSCTDRNNLRPTSPSREDSRGSELLQGVRGGRAGIQ